MVSDFLKEHGIKVPLRRRDFTEEEMRVAEKVAEEIAKKVDQVLKRGEKRNNAEL